MPLMSPDAVSGAMPPGAGAGPGVPAAGPAPAAVSPPATSEGVLTDEQVDSFAEKGMQVIYGGKSPDGELNGPIARMLRRNANDPVQSLADTAATISAKVIAAALDKQVSLDPAAAIAGTHKIVEELANIAGIEGIYDYDASEMAAAATRSGESLYKQTEGMEFFSQEEAMMDAGSIVQASQTGELDQAIKMLGSTDGAPPGAGMMGEGQ